MAFMQIVISPKIPEGASISPYVAEIHKYLKTTKFPHQLHDMGTIIEGEAGGSFRARREASRDSLRKAGTKRVYTTIQLDDRRDKKVHLGEKVDSVRKKMG